MEGSEGSYGFVQHNPVTRTYPVPSPLLASGKVTVFRACGKISVTDNENMMSVEDLGQSARQLSEALFGTPALTEGAMMVIMHSTQLTVRVKTKVTWTVAGRHIEECLTQVFGDPPPPPVRPTPERLREDELTKLPLVEILNRLGITPPPTRWERVPARTLRI